MKVIQMERNELLRERKRIEARVTRNLMRTNAIIFTLPKTANGMILSFSPFNINSSTNSFVKSESRWKYSHISNRLHTFKDERNKLEEEIRKYINFKEKDYIHTILSKFIYYEFSVRYCIQNKLPIISKHNHNKMKKLINKWKELSKNMHYKPTKQEKRKLKKLVRAERNDVIKRIKR